MEFQTDDVEESQQKDFERVLLERRLFHVRESLEVHNLQIQKLREYQSELESKLREFYPETSLRITASPPDLIWSASVEI